MGGVGHEHYLADAESGSASLLQLVRAHAHELIVAWFRVSGENFLIAHRLPPYQLVAVKASVITIRQAPKTVGRDLGSHVPIGRVDNEVGIPITVAFVKRKIDLLGFRR